MGKSVIISSLITIFQAVYALTIWCETSAHYGSLKWITRAGTAWDPVALSYLDCELPQDWIPEWPSGFFYWACSQIIFLSFAFTLNLSSARLCSSHNNSNEILYRENSYWMIYIILESKQKSVNVIISEQWVRHCISPETFGL